MDDDSPMHPAPPFTLGKGMTGFLDNAEIEIPCSNCGSKTKKSIGWIKSNNQFTCTCGTTIKLDADQFRGEIAKVDASFADLQRTLKSFGK